MKPSQKLAVRASEIRRKLAELSAKDSLTDEETKEVDELRNEMQDVETRYQAAVTSEDEPDENRTSRNSDDGEQAEVDRLRSEIRMANYVGAAMEQRGVSDGPEAEYNAAIGLKAGAFPLELLAPEAEERATTDADSSVMQGQWLDRLFANTAAMALGITMRSVQPGVASYPVTTAGASAAQRAREEAAADAAWTVGTTEIRPTRNAVRVVFTEEDTYRLPGLEEALRRDMGMALTEGVDRAIFLGDAGTAGNAADIVGLNTAAISAVELTQANKVKGPETLAAFLGMVDGVHAGSLGQLKVVAAIGAYRLWESTFVNKAADSETLAAFLRRAGLSWSTRGQIEDDTAAGDIGAYVCRSRGSTGAAVAAIWNSGMLIRDPYSGAAKGEIALTLSHFWGFALPRPANFQRLVFEA